MILPLFFILIGLALILIVLGKYVEAPVYSLLGFFLVFIMGIYLINNDLLIKQGSEISYDYTVFNDTAVVEKETSSYIYAPWQGNSLVGFDYKYLFGFFLAVASIMGYITVISQHKSRSIRRD